MSTIKSSGENLKLSSDNTKDIELQHNGSTKVTVKSDGKVGIGTTSPKRTLHLNNPSALTTKIQITNSSTGATTDGEGFQLGISNDGTANIEQRENLALTFSTNNTERMRIQSGGGISFNGDTATANALSDYEEGTWTPASSQLTINSINHAKYTKIGRVVNWVMYINVNAGSSATLVITGLPFTNEKYAMQSNINSSSANATITNPHFRIPPNSTEMYAIKNNDTGIDGSELDGSHIIASGTYQIA